MPSTATPLAVRSRRLRARPGVRRLAVGTLAAATAVAMLAAAGVAEAARTRWGRTRPVVVAARDLAPGETVDAGSVRTRALPASLVPRSALAAVPRGAVVRQPIVAGEPVVPARLAPLGLSGVAALVPPGRRAVAIPRGPAGLPPLRVGDGVDVVAVSAAAPGADPLAPADLAAAVQPAPAGAGVARPAGPPAPYDCRDGDVPPASDPVQGAARPGGAGPGGGEPPAPAASPAPEGGARGGSGPAAAERGPPAKTLVERALVVDVGRDAVTVAVPAPDAPRVAWALASGAVMLALAGQ